MTYNEGFSIGFYSFVFNYDEATRDQKNVNVLRTISEEGRKTLHYLYSGIADSVRYGINTHKKIHNQVNGSVFVICIPDGVVMLKCLASESGKVSMPGILLRKDEDLCMGWRLARWQLILIAVGASLPPGKYKYTMEGITDIANCASKKIDKKYIAKLSKFENKIMQEEVPASCALTNFPPEKLSLDFGENIVSGYNDDVDDKRSLPIDIMSNGLEPDHKLWIAKYQNKKKLSIFRLVFMPKKEFLKDKAEEYKSFDKERRHQELALLKEELAECSDYLWCVRVGFSIFEGIYTEYLSEETVSKIKSGRIEMATFLDCAWTVVHNSLAYFKERKKIVEKKEREEQEKRERKECEREKRLQEKLRKKEQKKYKEFPRPLDEDDDAREENTVKVKFGNRSSHRPVTGNQSEPTVIGGFVSKLFGKNKKF